MYFVSILSLVKINQTILAYANVKGMLLVCYHFVFIFLLISWLFKPLNVPLLFDLDRHHILRYMFAVEFKQFSENVTGLACNFKQSRCYVFLFLVKLFCRFTNILELSKHLMFPICCYSLFLDVYDLNKILSVVVLLTVIFNLLIINLIIGFLKDCVTKIIWVFYYF